MRNFRSIGSYFTIDFFIRQWIFSKKSAESEYFPKRLVFFYAIYDIPTLDSGILEFFTNDFFLNQQAFVGVLGLQLGL